MGKQYQQVEKSIISAFEANLGRNMEAGLLK